MRFRVFGLLFATMALAACNPVAPQTQVTNFEDCVAAGNPVMESYPRQCRSAQGDLFVEEVDEGIMPPNEYGDEEEPVFCTMDAKVCPDGSSVGRIAPNCEFAPCPGE